MPTPTKKLVYDFKRKSASLHSGNKDDIPLVDIIAYLNEAQERWFRNRVVVAEVDSQARNDLRKFEIKKAELDCDKVDDKCCKAKYPGQLFKILNQKALTSFEDCCSGITKEIILRTNQSDDINESRQSPYQQADFYYEQLPWDEAGEYMYIYHEGRMEVKKVIIDYYRKPNELHAPSLETCNGGAYYDYCGARIEKDTNFEECSNFSDQDITDLAVACYKRDVGDYDSYRTAMEKITNFGKIYKQ